MKVNKLFLVLLMLILCFHIVNAEITLYDFSASVYNLGDKVLVQGSVNYATDVRASLDLILNCGGSATQVGTILLNLKANQDTAFSNLITLPTDSTGKCTFTLNLVDLDGKTLESKEFSGFEVSNQLKSNFEVNKNQFQLGEVLNLKGTVNKQDNLVVDGVLVITFKDGSRVLFLDTVEFNDGVVAYSKTLNKLPSGIYNVDIIVRDNLGNFVSLPSLFTLTLSGSLSINPALDKTSYKPGDTLTLNGYVSNSLNKQVKNLNLEFVFENEVKTKKLASTSESFSVTYSIPTKIKTGKHQVNIIASDEDGNYDNKLLDFSVLAIPTGVSISLQGSSYDPEQKVIFKTDLFDQAGDSLTENINVFLYDNKGKLAGSKIVRTGTEDSILLPKQAAPGTWKLVVDGFGLSSEATFTVKDFKKLDATLVDKSLFVENTGNIPYNDILDIKGNDIIKTY